MPYDSTHLGGVQYFGSKSGPKMWFYTTTDALAAVRVAGYFDDAVLRGIQLGDVVFVNEVDDLDTPTTTNVTTNHVSAVDAVAGTATIIAATADPS